ncbi:MAG: T9SS C-terminal target domain-containing protein [Chitinophagia bacterium]|nr:T9SS C-terminal target domain-containing protein [Chitinophagia bacterium]
MFFAKYDSLGNLVWVKRYGSSREQFAHSLAADSCGHIWMTGSLDLRDSVVFDGHAAVSDIWAYDPTFIAGFDTSGTCFDASAINTGGDDQLGIAVDRRGNFYISGDYIYGVAWSPFVIGPDTLTINNTPSSTEYFFIGKYRYDTSQCNTFTGGNDSTTAVTEVWQRQLHDIRLFPNPAGNQFTIASSELITSVTITDLTGNVLFIGEFQDEKIDITTAGFAPGLYFVCVNKSQMEKLVIY